MNLLLFTLFPLAISFIDPNSNKQIFRSSAQSRGYSYLNCSNAACAGHCENGWTYFDETDSCYKIFRWETFYNAESRCRNYGAHLASIHSANENQFVADLAETGLEWPFDLIHARATWIGLRRADSPNGEWLWTDGTKAKFLAWAPNEPNNANGNEGCVELFSDRFEAAEQGYSLHYHKWNDFRCSTKVRSFVCKKIALH
ncbi:unnamed protein product [Cylicocyclus nassatus]|uniref:C-type lectin domain-containing protein n=1 Tax=Cylicocyclus nassatus TaxID=53992 RepID=A0AA36H063_CYLNA|nr:unnamed protein product [Cylicocyclus nassatus]